ncbi:uncharacterized protein METZ01_LOCUS420421, partial [marine metagenome]
MVIFIVLLTGSLQLNKVIMTII